MFPSVWARFLFGLIISNGLICERRTQRLILGTKKAKLIAHSRFPPREYKQLDLNSYDRHISEGQSSGRKIWHLIAGFCGKLRPGS